MQTIGSMKDIKNVVKNCLTFGVGTARSRLILECMLEMEEGPKHVQLHIKWTVGIHKRMIMVSFSRCSPLGPCHTSISVWKLPNFWCGHCQILADFGVLEMKECPCRIRHVNKAMTLWMWRQSKSWGDLLNDFLSIRHKLCCLYLQHLSSGHPFLSPPSTPVPETAMLFANMWIN